MHRGFHVQTKKTTHRPDENTIFTVHTFCMSVSVVRVQDINRKWPFVAYSLPYTYTHNGGEPSQCPKETPFSWNGISTLASTQKHARQHKRMNFMRKKPKTRKANQRWELTSWLYKVLLQASCSEGSTAGCQLSDAISYCDNEDCHVHNMWFLPLLGVHRSS